MPERAIYAVAAAPQAVDAAALHRRSGGDTPDQAPEEGEEEAVYRQFNTGGWRREEDPTVRKAHPTVGIVGVKFISSYPKLYMICWKILACPIHSANLYKLAHEHTNLPVVEENKKRAALRVFLF